MANLPWYIILPNSARLLSFKELLRNLSFTFPDLYLFYVAFGFDSSNWVTTVCWWLLQSTELFYFIDIVLNFFTAYENKESTYETTLKSIGYNYIRFGSFFLDLLLGFPF
jgi:hypothetical protein